MRDAVQIPFLVRDRQYLRDQKKPASGPEILIARPTQAFTIRGEEPFFDGPVTGRVAVLDFDAKRCDAVFSTTEVAPGQAVEVVFEG